MSKTRLSLISVVAGVLVFGVVFWTYAQKMELGPLEYGTAFLVGVVLIVSFIYGRKALANEKAGLPTDDEMSRRNREKSGLAAFISSLYIWFFILIFFTANDAVNSKLLVGSGVFAMIILYLGFYIYYDQKGSHLENKD